MSSTDANAVGLVAIIALAVLAIFILRRKKKYVSPTSLWLDSASASQLKDLDDKFIDFYHQVLTKYVAYYRNLNHADRKKFIDRLHELIENMKFLGEQGQEINLKVCILCCAPVTQITMGLETYLFNNYHTIIVYPRQFYSEKQEAYVKGGVSRGDAIFFSYEDLLKGYAVPNDSLNLGLHEMAHAIHIEYFDEDFERRFPEWEKVAEQEVLKMRYQQDPILRNYAGQNKHELFAVCIETFFEQPDDMKLRAPVLYEAMCNLLNQRPALV
ncbi:MAG: zinc-dependent peptidase [Crocinitomicaceae bacterium]|nr:zinc-dependent peptidase [Crocinitomicaceae bacterium]